ncbi:MAG: (4Fe-4S)-binding protein [Gammaproteobacteria bacterium]
MKVTWDENKCCHAGVCVNTLPQVFKIEAGRFVIDTEQAPEDAVIEVVNQCPSGALQTDP